MSSDIECDEDLYVLSRVYRSIRNIMDCYVWEIVYTGMLVNGVKRYEE